MQPIRFIPTLLVLGLCALATSCANAPAEPGGMPQPTAEHKELMQGVGSWEGTLTSYIPGQPESTIPAQDEVVGVGGFWTHSRFSCVYMGQPYIGTGLLGYNPATKSYVGTWVDSMSSHLAIMKGEKDAKTNALVMQWHAPNEQGVMTHQRSVTERTDDAYTITFYEGEGEERKHMVITMKRKKT